MKDAEAIDAAMAEFFKSVESRLVDFAEAVEARARDADPDWNHHDAAPELRNALDIILFAAEHDLMCAEQAFATIPLATDALRRIERGS